MFLSSTEAVAVKNCDDTQCNRHSLSHSQSRPPRDQSGFRDGQQLKLATKKARLTQRKFAKLGRRGESDRTILSKKPFHLFAGKRRLGKTQRR